MRACSPLLLAAFGMLPCASVAAQSMQRLSLQGSGALVFPTSEESDFENDTRLGWEGQLRYTFSRFSLGAGYQRSTVYRLETQDFSGSVSVGFLEPRYVILATNWSAFYLAGRAGLGSLVCSPDICAEQSLELALGGGGGILLLVTERIALDLGSQYFTTQFTRSVTVQKARTGYVLARVGLSIGL